MKKAKVSEMAWDVGLIRFNSGSVGLLRQRAELNSFSGFNEWMYRLSGNNQERTRKLEDLFLTKQSFTNFECELASLFLSEYVEFLIDSSHPFHDLYVSYLASKTFSQLPDDVREELVVGVLLRLIENVESEVPHVVFAQLLSLAQQHQNSPAFQRFLEIIDYVFSEGGRIRPVYLDLNTPLQFVREKTNWTQEMEKKVAMYTVSEMVKGMTAPVKKTPAIKMRSLANRLKESIKK